MNGDMSSTPIILLCGSAGSGKDTVGQIIARDYDAVCLGQADPMKRFVLKVFDSFTEEDLWGPSDLRNVETYWSKSGAEHVAAQFDTHCTAFVDEVLPDLSKAKGAKARGSLLEWFDNFAWPKLESGAGISPRYVLQTIGTEWGRYQSVDMWSNYAIKAARQLLAGGCDYDRTVGVRKDDVSYALAVITDGRFRNEVLNVRALGGAALRIDRASDTSAVEAAGVKGHASEKELTGIPSHFFSGEISNTGTLDQLRATTNYAIQTFFSSKRITYYGISVAPVAGHFWDK